ncbi:MAG: hypothetical protein ACK4KW_04650 [Gemmobacter sp.]
MELIADVLLAAGAFGAAIYCFVLGRRLSHFGDVESGMGGAIAVLSMQVDDLTRALAKAGDSAAGSTERLEALTVQAEAAATRLELLMASLHDLPEPGARGEADRRLRFVRRRPLRQPEVAE